MSKYLFQLGHQPQISIAEIQAVFTFKNKKIKSEKKDNFLIVETEKEIDCKNIINILGGTIKIAEKITEPSVVDFLNKTPKENKIQFSLSGNIDKKDALQIKKELKNLGRSVRYIEIKNTATLLHNKLIEKQGDITIINNEIFVTQAIQNFTEFGDRDYNRPGVDSVSGMLPPKLARIMINLAKAKPAQTLLDPFCGSGTVLMEALDLGFKNIIGSDISKKAIGDTEKNIKWIQSTYHLPPANYQLFNLDAIKLSSNIIQIQ